MHSIRMFPIMRQALTISRVVLRGDRDDNAVLCTNDKTFELKVAETSNTLLLTPSLSDPTRAGNSCLLVSARVELFADPSGVTCLLLV